MHVGGSGFTRLAGGRRESVRGAPLRGEYGLPVAILHELDQCRHDLPGSLLLPVHEVVRAFELEPRNVDDLEEAEAHLIGDGQEREKGHPDVHTNEGLEDGQVIHLHEHVEVLELETGLGQALAEQ